MAYKFTEEYVIFTTQHFKKLNNKDYCFEFNFNKRKEIPQIEIYKNKKDLIMLPMYVTDSKVKIFSNQKFDGILIIN